MQQAPEVLEAFGQLQRFLAKATMEAVDASMKQPWKEVVLEISAGADARHSGSKLSVVSLSGAAIQVPLSEMLRLAAQEMWDTRTLGIVPNWKGMALKITSAGQCTVNFDYAD